MSTTAVDFGSIVSLPVISNDAWTGRIQLPRHIWTNSTPKASAPHGAFILANASCIGSAETTIIPSNGESISTMRTTAPAIESAPTNSAITTNILRGAKRPKLTNNTNSHTIIINTHGCGTCSDSSASWSQVAFARAAAVSDAVAASARWDAVLGANSVKLC